MNGTILTSFTVGLLLSSCTDGEHNDKKKNSKTSDFNKKEFYLSKMEEKNFQLVNNGPCDDALEDTIHERSIAYFDSQTFTDTTTIIEFKLIDACCQEFLGDYSIENDTLAFKFEQVNDEVCTCLCWYRYKLTVNELKGNYKYVIIEEK
jgi:glycerol-3-phosphate O-acyltransferase